jgi:hypothetical protein
LSVLGMFGVVLMVCLVNAVIALVCSLYAKKTSISLLTTYVLLLLLYVGPPAILSLMQIINFDPGQITRMEWTGVTSPFTALFAIPLDENLKREYDNMPANVGNLGVLLGYFAFSVALVGACTAAMFVRLRSRRGWSE